MAASGTVGGLIWRPFSAGGRWTGYQFSVNSRQNGTFVHQ
jgi:hypothetical protein